MKGAVQVYHIYYLTVTQGGAVSNLYPTPQPPTTSPKVPNAPVDLEALEFRVQNEIRVQGCLGFRV